MSPSEAGSMARGRRRATRVRQACDACHVRKVRCDGRHQCVNCCLSRSTCTYNALHKKPGPKGPRYGQRPDDRLRRTGPAPDPRCGNPASRTPGAPTSGGVARPCSTCGLRQDVVGMGETFKPSPQLSCHVIRQPLDTYLALRYPITPVIDEARVEGYMCNFAKCPGCYGVLVSCCATVVQDRHVMSSASADPPGPSPQRGIRSLPEPPVDLLISEALRSRRFYGLAGNQSLTQIQTSLLLHFAYSSLGNDPAAWFYLREAVTMLQTLRYHEEATYEETSDRSVAEDARRAFWALFVAERVFAIRRCKPLTLQPTIGLPRADPPPAADAAACVLPGFRDLIALLRPIDAGFVTAWNSSATGSTMRLVGMAEVERLARLQTALSNCLINVSAYPETQQAELLITRAWLKNVVWQLCLSVTTLAGSDSRESMSLGYPLSIARDMVLVFRLLPRTAFAANRVSILERVSHVGRSLANVLSLNAPAILRPMTYVASTELLTEMSRITSRTLGVGCEVAGLRLEELICE